MLGRCDWWNACQTLRLEWCGYRGQRTGSWFCWITNWVLRFLFDIPRAIYGMLIYIYAYWIMFMSDIWYVCNSSSPFQSQMGPRGISDPRGITWRSDVSRPGDGPGRRRIRLGWRWAPFGCWPRSPIPCPPQRGRFNWLSASRAGRLGGAERGGRTVTHWSPCGGKQHSSIITGSGSCWLSSLAQAAVRDLPRVNGTRIPMVSLNGERNFAPPTLIRG